MGVFTGFFDLNNAGNGETFSEVNREGSYREAFINVIFMEEWEMEKKKKVNRTKRERGRPQKLGEADLERIKELARAGLSVEQIAAEMATSRKSVETLIDERDLKSEIQVLRASPSAMAKLLIMEELKRGDVNTAKWLLEREAKQKLERERASLLRAQRRALEPSRENTPDALPSVYWEKVNRYFSSQYENKPEQEQSGDNTSDNTDDQTDKGEE